MKLHLPIALLAAVVSAQFASAGVSYTYDGQKDPVSENWGNGIYNGHIESVYQGDYSSASLAASEGHAKGNISAIPRTLTDENGKEVNAATSAHVILTGEGSKATYVIGGGPRNYFVTGDKTVTVQDKAFAAYIAGGKSYTTETATQTIAGYEGYSASYWQPKNGDGTITINLKDAACTAIFGGNAQSANVPYSEMRAAIKKLGAEGAREYALSADSALALDEKVVINVENGRLGYSSYDTAYSKEALTGYAYPVISGTGTGGYSVNNDIDINISGDSIVNGSIVAGASSTYSEKQDTLVPAYVGGSTSISLKDSLVRGNVYGGGDGDAVVKGDTHIVLDGSALVEGDVYGAGRNGDTVLGNTNVVLRGDKVEVKGIISGRGEGGLSTVDGDRVITFDDYGDVNWSQIKDFNVVELTGGTSTTLGEDAEHTLSTDFEKVVISGPSTTVVGTIGRPVELHITDDCWVELNGNLTTNAGSVIKDNTSKDIEIGKNATFNGTKIENSTIVAGGDIAVNSGSVVTDANLVAANGNVSFSNSTMNGGEITLGGKLSVAQSDVTIDKINGVDELSLNLQGGAFGANSSLTVNDDVTLAADSRLLVVESKEYFGTFVEGSTVTLTANSITVDKKLECNTDQGIYSAVVNATKGDITIGAHNGVADSDLVAKDSVILKDGASLTHGSTATAQTGDVWLNGGVKVENSDLIAENGIVKFNQSTMNGGNIVAGEALQMDNASVVVADSINNGKAVKLDVNSGAYLNLSKEPTAASLTVNSDLVLADGSKFEGQKKVPYVTSDNNKDVEGLLAAHSIKSEGAVTFDLATVKATAGNIELADGSKVTNTNLTANGSVQLTGTTMAGGTISAGEKVALSDSTVSVSSISKNDGSAAVLDSTNSKLTVTEGNLSLGSGSVVKDSALTATQGDVVLSGTTMTGSTVETNGKFVIGEGSNVTMDSLTGLNNIHISDSSLSTEKLVVNKGETFNVTGDGVDRTGDKLILSGTGVALEEAFVVNGEATIKDATLVITGSNSQLGIAYGANGGKLVIDGSNVDMHEASTLHMGYNAGEAGELVITNGSNFLSASNNAWLGGGKVEVSNGSTLDVCNSENSYNYRTIMGWEGHTLDVAVTAGEMGASTFNSAATQLITNYHSGTEVNILVSGKDSSFNHAGTIESNSSYAIGATGEWVEKDGKWYDKGTLGLVGSGNGTKHTLTYLLDSGTDEYGAKKAAVNNVFTTITAEQGGSVNIDSAITYVGSFQDVATYGDQLNKQLNLNVGEGSSMSFNRMEVYANTNIDNDGSFKATDINVHNGATFDYAGSGKMTASSLGVDKGGVMNIGSLEDGRAQVELNAPGSVKTGIISGELNVNNTDLVVTGSSSSQFWISDGGVMNVDNGSTVDLSKGTTLGLGNVGGGTLNIAGGSTLTGGANNLWVYGDSTIKVTEGSSMGVCNDTDHYNYRVLLGITNEGNGEGEAYQSIKVEGGSSFTSSATQFVTNYHSNTGTEIKVSGKESSFVQTGQTVNKNHYVVGTTGNWVQDEKGNWLDAGSAGVGGKYVEGKGDTITYLLNHGTDKDGVLGYAVKNSYVDITAKDGGTVKFDSAMTYVGNIGVTDEFIEANKTNHANFYIQGADSSISFKEMQMYATTNVIFGQDTNGTFTASKITVNDGAKLNINGNGKDSGAQFILSGTGKSNDEALVVDGTMTITDANLVMKGSNSQLGIGYGADGGVLNVTNSKVDLSDGTTLHMGYYANTSNSQLNISNSEFVGGSNNAWLGGGTINVTDKSTLSVCSSKDDHYNYRTILGLSGNTVNLNVKSGSTFESSASQFITNFSNGTTVNIKVDGEGSSLVHNNEIKSKPSYGFTKTTTYLLDSGTDASGNKYAAVDHVKTNITASKGGNIAFNSDVTYVGSAQDKALGYTDKKLNITVADKDSSVSFKAMEIYADTTIDNKGDMDDFFASSVSVYDGATLETYGSLDLNEVALAGGTLFNAGSLELDSLVLEHANLLFAVSDWNSTITTLDYKGAELTGFRDLTVSINNMIDSYGIVLGGSAAEDLIAAGDAGVQFSFTLATGSALFEEQLAYVLGAEDNLADFSITVGDAVLRLGDGELKDLKVEDTENGVVISGTAIIPEPTTATLSLLALAALAARRRRK